MLPPLNHVLTPLSHVLPSLRQVYHPSTTLYQSFATFTTIPKIIFRPLAASLVPLQAAQHGHDMLGVPFHSLPTCVLVTPHFHLSSFPSSSTFHPYHRASALYAPPILFILLLLLCRCLAGSRFLLPSPSLPLYSSSSTSSLPSPSTFSFISCCASGVLFRGSQGLLPGTAVPRDAKNLEEFIVELKTVLEGNRVDKRPINFLFENADFVLSCNGDWFEFGVADGKCPLFAT